MVNEEAQTTESYDLSGPAKPKRWHGLTFRTLRIVGVLGLTVLLMMTTDPRQVPAVLLTVPFAGLFLFIYLVVREVLRFLQPVESVSGTQLTHRPRLLSAVIAAFPVLLLVLQSIMELNRWDVLIALVIFILAYVFVSRGAWPARKS